MLLYDCCFHFDKTHFPLPVQRLLRSFIVQFTAFAIYIESILRYHAPNPPLF